MLAEDLKSVIKGEVYADEQTLKKYSRDTSIFEVRPTVVVAPKDSADISALIQYASTHKKEDSTLSLTVRSGGTDMTGGPLNSSIIVDMTRYFNRIIDVGADYAIVQPGVYYRDLDKETRRRGMIMPSYPASREICTVGGMVANNSGGEKTLAYGKTEKYVRSLKVILADGNEYVIQPISKKDVMLKARLKSFEGQMYKKLYALVVENKKALTEAKPNVSKNSAGYALWDVWDSEKEIFDLPKLFVGSQGTLGIITEITFGLVPVKKVSKLAVIFLKNINRLGEIIVTTMKHGPESFESYDDQTFKLAARFFPAMIRIIKPKNAFKMALQFLPEVRMLLTNGFPKLVLMAEFTGDTDEEVNGKLNALSVDLKTFQVPVRLIRTEEEASKYWGIRRESFNLLRQHIKDRRTVPFIDDIAVRPEVLPEFLPKLTAILNQEERLLYTIAGHAGDGNFHIIPLMDLTNPLDRAIIPRLADKVYNLVLEYKGTLTAEHNDGLIRSPYLERMYGKKIIDLFLEVKNIFDPERIFNPRKKVESSLEYSLSHMKRS